MPLMQWDRVDDNPKEQPQMLNTVEKLAQNAWLRMIQHIALPIIAALLWQQWQSLDSIEKQIPTMELRVSILEDFAKAMAGRMETSSVDRASSQQTVMVEIAGIKADVKNLSAMTNRIETLVADLVKQQSNLERMP